MSEKLTCQSCGKRLSRKTARIIDGVVMCSNCMFKPRSDRDVAAEAVGRHVREALRLAGPAGLYLKIRIEPASVDGRPQGGDSEAAPFTSGAVPAQQEDAPTPSFQKDIPHD